MRIFRLFVLCTVAACALVLPAAAGQRSGHAGAHHPRPVITPPMLHGAPATQPAPVRPPVHAYGPGRHHGGHGRFGRGDLIAPLPYYGWSEPTLVGRSTSSARSFSQVGPVVVMPRAGGWQSPHAAGARTVLRPKPGYYDIPRPMAKIIHLRQASTH